MENPTIEVVINSEYGGFRLSSKCKELISELTQSLVTDETDIPRHHAMLVFAVKKLGPYFSHADSEDKFAGKRKNMDGPLQIVTVNSLNYKIREYDGFEHVETPHPGFWTSADDGTSTAEPVQTRTWTIPGNSTRITDIPCDTWICDECSIRKPRFNGPAAWRQTFERKEGPRVREKEWWCLDCMSLTTEELSNARKVRTAIGVEASLRFDAVQDDALVTAAIEELKSPEVVNEEQREFNKLVVLEGDGEGALAALRRKKFESQCL